MWDLIRAEMERINQRKRYKVFHNPAQAMPYLDFSLSGSIEFVPHASVPVGQVWVMDPGAGSIVTGI